MLDIHDDASHLRHCMCVGQELTLRRGVVVN